MFEFYAFKCSVLLACFNKALSKSIDPAYGSENGDQHVLVATPAQYNAHHVQTECNVSFFSEREFKQ